MLYRMKILMLGLYFRNMEVVKRLYSLYDLES
jgi:hypothetical protein